MASTVKPACDFEWSHIFEVFVEKSERSRIWCEPHVHPRNAFASDKIAASHLGGHIADLLTAFGAQRLDQTMLMVNVRDGYLPVLVPPQVHAGCLAFTDTQANLQVGRQVLDFYGRPDVQLELPDNENEPARHASHSASLTSLVFPAGQALHDAAPSPE